ncbi:polyketide synthase, partial [Pedobacter sp. UYP1]|uniref:polyketide synthase n=1 Tax=Pedobacter sp. UYP1 TaxID=1756396 RepID=UPI003399A06F
MALKKEYNGLEIAIIGMSGQFPSSETCRHFWEHLKSGTELLKTFTDDELIEKGMSVGDIQNPRYVKTVGVMDQKEYFDSSFFGYTPEEATFMEPQIRLFHQQCWAALEDAGYSSAIDKKKIGLFAGATTNDNWKVHAYSKSKDTTLDPFYLSMIIDQSFMSTLISYKLNLRGPSFYIDSACSTSLAAVHLACRSLLTRDSTIALAGGISITSKKNKGYIYEPGMISSEDGHCRAFDSKSSGTVSGEGAGVIVLKKLSDAIKDRDNIYAIIKSTSVNNDGNNKVGYTAPSVNGQAECIVTAQRLAGVDPDTINYIEAHGTGTRLGDPIEIKALNQAFAKNGQDKFCAIGSVKTNIGHLDAAAGVAGLIKTALSLTHR